MSEPVGIDTYSYLYHPTLGTYYLNTNRLSMSVKVSSSESRIDVTAIIDTLDLFQVSDRIDGTSQISVDLITRYGMPNDDDLSASQGFVFNAKSFDYAAGPKSSSVTIKGTKYIYPGSGPTARTLNRHISKDMQRLGATERIIYAVPILDIFGWKPADTLPDGTIKSINYEISPNSLAATLEVIP